MPDVDISIKQQKTMEIRLKDIEDRFKDFQADAVTSSTFQKLNYSMLKTQQDIEFFKRSFDADKF